MPAPVIKTLGWAKRDSQSLPPLSTGQSPSPPGPTTHPVSLYTLQFVDHSMPYAMLYLAVENMCMM